MNFFGNDSGREFGVAYVLYNKQNKHFYKFDPRLYAEKGYVRPDSLAYATMFPTRELALNSARRHLTDVAESDILCMKVVMLDPEQAD